MALIRGVGGENDPYEAGTMRERAYLRSIPIGKLSNAKVDMLDDKEDMDNDEDDDVDPEKYAWKLYQ